MSHERDCDRDDYQNQINVFVFARVSKGQAVKAPPSSEKQGVAGHLHLKIHAQKLHFFSLPNGHLQHGTVNNLWDILS